MKAQVLVPPVNQLAEAAAAVGGSIEGSLALAALAGGILMFVFVKGRGKRRVAGIMLGWGVVVVAFKIMREMFL